MKVLEPAHRAREQKTLHLMARVVEYQRVPVGMLAFLPVAVLVEGRAVETRQRVPFEADQAFIAGMQMEREDEAARRANRILFCDTTPLMTSIYSRFYWHRVDEAVASLAEPHRYDLTVVTAPDTPWEPDGLQRESAQMRAHIHQQVLHTLDVRGIGWHLVEGSVQERVGHVVGLLSDMGACPPAGAVSESGA